MKLDRTGAMQTPFCFDVGGMGFFGCAEVAESDCLAIDLNDAAPLPVIEVSAEKTASASALSDTLVSDVFSLGNISEVADSVVSPVAIDVVNVVAGGFTVNIQPSKSMNRVASTGDAYAAIPLVVNCPNGKIQRDAAARFNESGKDAGVGVVVKQLFESFLRGGRIIGSHAVVPFKQWFGQKPQSVSALLGLRHFSTGAS